MYSIYKYPFETSDVVELEIPEMAEILCVQTQAGKPCIWAKVDTEEIIEAPRRFRIFGTGHNLGGSADRLKYVGTYQINCGYLVFHVFEEITRG